MESLSNCEIAAPPGAGTADRFAFAIGAGEGGERLDRFLSQAAAARGLALSRTRLKALIEAGQVTIDGAEARDPAARVAEGEESPSPCRRPRTRRSPARTCRSRIVFEDEHLLIVDKPAGLVVHPAPGHAAGTLVNALIRHCGDSLSGVGGVKRPGIVHRLDKDTSGLLVVAKNDAAHQGLAALFADHGRSGSLRREYRALVWGAPDAHGGNRRRRRSAATRSVARRWRWSPTSAAGRRSPTGASRKRLGPVSLVACRLETGRTHQIRVHLAHIGHPLLGGFGLRSGFQDQGEPAVRGGAGGARRPRPPGPARRDPRLRPPHHRRAAGLRKSPPRTI